MSICRKCQGQLDVDQNICPQCGMKVNGDNQSKVSSGGKKDRKLKITAAVVILFLAIGTIAIVAKDAIQSTRFMESKQAYQLARVLLEAEDYIGAINQLLQVEEDFEDYQEAQLLLAQARASFKRVIIAEAEELIKKYEYSEAIDLLENAVSIVLEVEELEALIATASALSSLIGNHPGNIANGGRVAFGEGWVYYSPIGGNGLYRVRSDGTDIEKIVDKEVGNLNVYDGWLYYQNVSDDRDESIYRMATDGSSNERLNFKSSWSMNISAGWIYYRAGGDIYRMRPDGSKEEKFLAESSSNGIYMTSPLVIDNWLYYIASVPQNAEFPISRIHTETGEVDGAYVIHQNYDYTVSGDWLYLTYWDTRSSVITLYRINVETEEEEIISHDSAVMRINVFNEWIYYTATDGKIYRKRISGGGSQILYDSKQAMFNCFLYLTDCGVYFQWAPRMGKLGKMHRMDHDGSNLRILE